MDLTATILAVASPAGPALRGLVRVSGDHAYLLLEPHLLPERRDRLVPERGICRARLSIDGWSIPVLALTYVAPHSYCGQDTIELELTGNWSLLRRVVDDLIESGRRRRLDVRRAEPGEFTARAFFNDRMSLTQAEGVAATIAAQSDAELRAAHLLRQGGLGSLAAGLADDLTATLALVESGIDFTDQEDVVAIAPSDLERRLRDLRDRIAGQLSRAVGTEQLEAIPRVVLAGPVNAGKSTLFNALLGRHRAVVSPLAGTTRDVLTEPLVIPTAHGPAEVMLVDLAGGDDDASALGRLMQEQARSARDRADLVLRCTPAAEPPPPAGGPDLVVLTKADLAPEAIAPTAIRVSARTGAGLKELRAAIAERLADRAVSLAAGESALQPRHEAALRSARDGLEEALRLVDPSRSAPTLDQPELIAACMRAALDDLGTLVGHISPDDVLGKIFATFCVGK